MLEKYFKRKKLTLFIFSLFFLFLSISYFLDARNKFDMITYKNYIYLERAYKIFSFYQRNRNKIELLFQKINLGSIINNLNLSLIKLELLYQKELNPYIIEKTYKLRIKVNSLNEISELLDILKNKYFIFIDAIKINKLTNDTLIAQITLKKYLIKGN
ncbi:MAG TPA: hypothetical protein EYH39_04750 [Desulfurobacteriaceae bacterium]|nr:hypothetical protein [Desulfurobacteriaceae bacterium]